MIALQIFLFVCICFFIAVCFYKQHRTSIELLQVEFTSIQDSLKDLAQERQPIIIRSVPIPVSITLEKLSLMERLDPFQLASGTTLKDYKTGPEHVLPDYQNSGQPILTLEQSHKLAKELALDTWAAHTIQDIIADLVGIFSPLYTQSVGVLLAGKGMERALSVYTILMPVEGKYTLSIVNKKSESFLPSMWKYRFPRTLTINDSPLVGEIQYIDVVLRPGTLICLPPHCIYSLEPATKEFHSAVVIEVDSVVSKLTKFLEDLQN